MNHFICFIVEEPFTDHVFISKTTCPRELVASLQEGNPRLLILYEWIVVVSEAVADAIMILITTWSHNKPVHWIKATRSDIKKIHASFIAMRTMLGGIKN